jgi:endonuclease/exonuclease/phosphatase family metal-dependent hydrolase
VTRRAILALTLLATSAISCRTAKVIPRDLPLRVMSYNIQAGGGNLDSIAAAIRSAAPDIVGLQEVDVHWSSRSSFVDQAEELARQLKMQVRFAPIYRLPATIPSAPAREYGVAILSRFSITAFRNAMLTRLSTQDTAAGPTLMPGMVEAVVDAAGQPVQVFVTHLDYRADPAVRVRQVTETLGYLSSSRLPAILTGDLNASPDAPELQPLFRVLRDSWGSNTDPGLTYPATSPVKRIDYVLTSPHFLVRSAVVPLITASDHRPVVVDLSLRRVP